MTDREVNRVRPHETAESGASRVWLARENLDAFERGHRLPGYWTPDEEAGSPEGVERDLDALARRDRIEPEELDQLALHLVYRRFPVTEKPDGAGGRIQMEQGATYLVEERQRERCVVDDTEVDCRARRGPVVADESRRIRHVPEGSGRE